MKIKDTVKIQYVRYIAKEYILCGKLAYASTYEFHDPDSVTIVLHKLKLRRNSRKLLRITIEIEGKEYTFEALLLSDLKLNINDKKSAD